jgi:blocked-early-in-transport protein 1
MSRRYGAGGVSDRNAMLAGYGYGNYSASPQAPSIGRTASPFEQPYASTSASASTGGSASSRHPFASSSSAQAQAQRATPLQQEDWSEYDRKKYDESPVAPTSTSSSKWWGGSDRQAEQLEEQNDERLQGLSDRVKILKDITLGIGNEVREGTKELGTLGEAMSGASAFLGGTFQRMNKMAKRQGGWFWNMMGFLLFVCWLFVSRGREGGVEEQRALQAWSTDSQCLCPLWLSGVSLVVEKMMHVRLQSISIYRHVKSGIRPALIPLTRVTTHTQPGWQTSWPQGCRKSGMILATRFPIRSAALQKREEEYRYGIPSAGSRQSGSVQ